MNPGSPSLVAVQHREGSSLRADFSWVFVGNAVYAGGQWAILMLLAKLTRPELVGQYALGLAIVLPVIMFASLQLRLVVASDISQQIHFGHYLSLRLLTTILALIIIFVITLLGYHWEMTEVILLVGLAQAIEAISDVFYARLQLHDRMDRISKSLIARSVLSALGLTAGVYFSGSLLWGIVGILLARTIVLLGYDIRDRTHGLAPQSRRLSQNETLKPRWDLNVQRELLCFSFPLGIISVLVALNSSIPRYFVAHALGERALGIFSAIAFMFAAGSLVAVSLGQSVFTRLARSYVAENLVEFRSLLGKLLALGAALGVCGVIVARLAGREILTILFRPEYAERADLLPWIMAVGGVGYMAQFLGFGMTAARYYNSQIVLFILTNLSVAAASYLLITRQGLLGAIFAMLISVVVQLAGSIIILVVGLRRYTRASLENVEAL
jgi:O-antigen/teichoic acid export membrane protein